MDLWSNAHWPSGPWHNFSSSPRCIRQSGRHCWQPPFHRSSSIFHKVITEEATAATSRAGQPIPRAGNIFSGSCRYMKAMSKNTQENSDGASNVLHKQLFYAKGKRTEVEDICNMQTHTHTHTHWQLTNVIKQIHSKSRSCLQCDMNCCSLKSYCSCNACNNLIFSYIGLHFMVEKQSPKQTCKLSVALAETLAKSLWHHCAVRSW